MVTERHSFTEISQALPGRSVNACIGRAHRKGLRSGEAAPAAKSVSVIKPRKNRANAGGAVHSIKCRQRARPVAVRQMDPTEYDLFRMRKKITINALRYGMCKFPLWSDTERTPDVGKAFYCGAEADAEWCPMHSKRCWREKVA